MGFYLSESKKGWRYIFILLLGFSLFTAIIAVIVALWNEEAVQEEVAVIIEESPAETVESQAEPEEAAVIETFITVSAAGDFTLGSDLAYGYQGSFVEGLNDIFIEDDFSTVNLETTLTDAAQTANKKFRFKEDPSYAGILQTAGIEAVNLANNHSFDYWQKGYDDMVAALENHHIGYFGGNRNPSDKDTFVFQQTFYFEDGVLTDEKTIRIVPFSISSVAYRNDYQPTLLTGSEAERIKNKIIEVSNRIHGSDWLVYEKSSQASVNN